jgi:hypothetical protein
MPRSGRRKGGSYLDFNKEQKSEFRRLVQNANRRVTRATEAYEREGMDIPPSFLVGGKQDRSEWYSDSMAFSRSMDFKTEKEYRQALEFFKSFDPKTPGRNEKRPTMTEYRKTQHKRTVEAMQNILGIDVPKELVKKIKKMSAPQMTKFWASFSKKASRMGMKYSSNDAMMATLAEFFPEDIEQIKTAQWEESMIDAYKGDMMKKKVF